METATIEDGSIFCKKFSPKSYTPIVCTIPYSPLIESIDCGSVFRISGDRTRWHVYSLRSIPIWQQKPVEPPTSSCHHRLLVALNRSV